MRGGGGGEGGGGGGGGGSGGGVAGAGAVWPAPRSPARDMRERRVRKRGSEWRGANSSALLKCSASLSPASTARSIKSRAPPNPPRRARERGGAGRAGA